MSAVNYLAPAWSVILNEARLDPSAVVSDLSVTLEQNTLDSVNLTLANPFPTLRWTHGADRDTLAEGGSIKIRLGYTNCVETVFDGEITEIRPDFPVDGTPTITVVGHTRLHHLLRSTRTRTFTEMTDGEIAQQVAADAKLGATVDNTSASVRYDVVKQSNATDYDFLLKRASLIDYEVRGEGSSLVFRKISDDEQTSFTLVWGDPVRGFAPERNTLPLLSFSPSVNGLNQLSAVVVRGQDPLTREAIVARAGGSGEIPLGTNVLEVVDRPVGSQEEAQQLADALYESSRRRTVTGSGSAIGTPALRAGLIVDLQGIGRYSGPYRLTQVTHAVGGNGFQTSFSVEAR